MFCFCVAMYVCKEGVHDLHAYGLKKAISGKLPCIVSSMCIYFEGACKSDLPILALNIIERHRKIAGGAKDTMYNGKKKHFSRDSNYIATTNLG